MTKLTNILSKKVLETYSKDEGEDPKPSTSKAIPKRSTDYKEADRDPPRDKKQRLEQVDARRLISQGRSDRVEFDTKLSWRRSAKEIDIMRNALDNDSGGSSFRLELTRRSKANKSQFCYYYNEGRCNVTNDSHRQPTGKVLHFCSDCALVVPGWINMHAAGDEYCPIRESMRR